MIIIIFLKIIYFDLVLGDGQFNPVAKVGGGIKNAATHIKDTGMTVVDTCSKIGECAKQNGGKVVNTTVTKAKETINKIPIHSITDIISKSKCIIPKDANNIVRAALLQQCISPNFSK